MTSRCVALAITVTLYGCADLPQDENVSQAQLALTTTGVNVWHWNVIGHEWHAGRLDTGLIEVMGDSIRTNSAEFVSVNEICRGQYSRLIDNLDGGSYAGPGSPAKWNSGPYSASFARFTIQRDAQPGYCGCVTTCTSANDYGNAIFYKYGLTNSSSILLDPQDPNFNEDFKLLCASSAELSHLRLCTTHITATYAYTVGQMADVWTLIEDRYDIGDTVILGGDFNLEPNDEWLDYWYDSSVNTANNDGNFGVYHELDDADGANCVGYGEPTFGGGDPPSNPCHATRKKIDGFFVRSNKLFNNGYNLDSRTIPTTCDSLEDVNFNGIKNDACSDHNKVDGYAPVYVNE